MASTLPCDYIGRAKSSRFFSSCPRALYTHTHAHTYIHTFSHKLTFSYFAGLLIGVAFVMCLWMNVCVRISMESESKEKNTHKHTHTDIYRSKEKEK